MKLTPKQIKIFRNIFVSIAIQTLILWPIFFVITGLPINFINSLKLHLDIYAAYLALLCCILYFGILPKVYLIYSIFFDIVEANNSTFFQALKLAVKRALCQHLGYEAKFEENPQPMLFLKFEAKCSDCGIETYKIRDRAVDNYKIRLADNVLFQRNIEKFPEFYESMKAKMDIRPVDITEELH